MNDVNKTAVHVAKAHISIKNADGSGELLKKVIYTELALFSEFLALLLVACYCRSG